VWVALDRSGSLDRALAVEFGYIVLCFVSLQNHRFEFSELSADFIKLLQGPFQLRLVGVPTFHSSSVGLPCKLQTQQHVDGSAVMHCYCPPFCLSANNAVRVSTRPVSSAIFAFSGASARSSLSCASSLMSATMRDKTSPCASLNISSSGSGSGCTYSLVIRSAAFSLVKVVGCSSASRSARKRSSSAKASSSNARSSPVMASPSGAGHHSHVRCTHPKRGTQRHPQRGTVDLEHATRRRTSNNIYRVGVLHVQRG